MELKSLTLQNFRSYQAQSWNFSHPLVVIWGENGIGKTNFLEAISLLSTGRSWRASSCLPLIQSQASQATISGQLEDKTQLKVELFPRKKVLRRHEKVVPWTQHLGRLPTLLFSPEQIGIFRGEKRLRQSFFDRWLSQFDANYRQTLGEAQSLLRAKQAVLMHHRPPQHSWEDLQPLVQPYNQQLTPKLSTITQQRRALLSQLTPWVKQAWQELFPRKKDDLQLKLQTAEVDTADPERITEFWIQHGEREWQAGKNLLSPQRDDFQIFWQGVPVIERASRGEERSVLLALLVAQKEYWFAQHQRYPLLLLDDCFSELDQERQEALERLCHQTQAFLTTTHNDHFRGFSQGQFIALGGD